MITAVAVIAMVHSMILHRCFLRMDLFHWMGRVLAVPEVANDPQRTDAEV
jgi:hypothetical protein